MHFAFSDEQLQLRRAVRGVLEVECTVRALRDLGGASREQQALQAAARWRALAALGLAGLLVPTAEGGLGLQHRGPDGDLRGGRVVGPPRAPAGVGGRGGTDAGRPVAGAAGGRRATRPRRSGHARRPRGHRRRSGGSDLPDHRVGRRHVAHAPCRGGTGRRGVRPGLPRSGLGLAAARRARRGLPGASHRDARSHPRPLHGALAAVGRHVAGLRHRGRGQRRSHGRSRCDGIGRLPHRTGRSPGGAGGRPRPRAVPVRAGARGPPRRTVSSSPTPR